MADVISVSSGDSDVEIVGSYSNVMTKDDPLPLTAVRVDIDVVNANVPPRYIDLTDPKWTLPELKMRKRLYSTALSVVDLTDGDLTNGPEQETENLPPNECQFMKESLSKGQTSNNEDTLQKHSSEHPVVFAAQQDCGNPKPKLRRLISQTEDQKQINDAHDSPGRILKRPPLRQTHFKDLDASQCSVYLTKDCSQTSLCFRQPNNNVEEMECINNLERSLNESHPDGVESSGQVQREKISDSTSAQLLSKNSEFLQNPADSPHSASELSTCEDKTIDFCSSIFTPSPASPLSQFKAKGMELDKADTRQSFSDISPPSSPSTQPNSNCQPCDLKSLSSLSHVSFNYSSQVDPISTSEHGQSEKTEPAVFLSKTEDVGEGSGSDTYRDDLGADSPVPWDEGSDREDINEDRRSEMHFRAASTEDRNFVCPVTLQKMMSGPAPSLIDMDDEGFGAPEVLCHQSLSLVYSTIDENYTEGTLQLLSDLLQPGYYPPKNITTHLLHGILLDPQCPYHLCEQAFNLLMRTQRHHMADKSTVPWNWEMLTSLMAKQDHAKKHRSEVVCMFLEYVVQTLWDDFQAKRSLSVPHQSIAKATLSCDQKFHQVRDVIKWLFEAIVKSTDHGESMAKERDVQIRMVSIFQRMLSLSLEVDRSPALSSGKLSQELFHMLISNVPLRAHRMMLLESLQSKLLRCRLLEHLLDYACPLKIRVPMSLSLLLHFLKNCTLASDPTDGTERWQRWEELVHLLWMLLLSYNKAMKGYLYSLTSEQSGRGGKLVYRADDKVSRSAICEAVEAFLSRSQADLGQALPPHVEESLTYLQDHLLDVCQC